MARRSSPLIDTILQLLRDPASWSVSAVIKKQEENIHVKFPMKLAMTPVMQQCPF